MTDIGNIRATSEFELFIDPETGWDVRLIKFMRDSINVADNTNPNAWAILSDQGNLTLKVRNYMMIVVNSQTCGICFAGNVKDVIFDELEGIELRDEYKNIDATYVRSITGDQISSLSPDLIARHHQIIRQLAAGTKTRSASATRHRPHAVEEIGRIAGIVSQPAYLSQVQREAGLKPQEHWDQAMVDRVIRSIHLANQAFVGSWSIIRINGESEYTHLHVGGFIVASLGPDRYQL